MNLTDTQVEDAARALLDAYWGREVWSTAANEVKDIWRDRARIAIEAAVNKAKLPTFRCDNCDNGVEIEWEFCAWCGATKDWVHTALKARE